MLSRVEDETRLIISGPGLLFLVLYLYVNVDIFQNYKCNVSISEHRKFGRTKTTDMIFAARTLSLT